MRIVIFFVLVAAAVATLVRGYREDRRQVAYLVALAALDARLAAGVREGRIANIRRQTRQAEREWTELGPDGARNSYLWNWLVLK